MGIGHYENFPVASFLCPPRLRAPIRAIYAFARTADDLADEGDEAPQVRLAALARYRHALNVTASNAHLGATSPLDTGWPTVFVPLRAALASHGLPVVLLLALLDAFEQDVQNPAYESRAQLLAYCSRSANPIGRLLLHLYGIDDERSLAQSDAICTALQLINFWQDLSVDLPRGRNYIPRADAHRHAVDVQQLPTACADPSRCAGARALVRELVHWAASTLAQGATLPLRIPGRAGWELRLVMQGGWRILERIAGMDYGTCVRRPRLTARDAPLLLWRAGRHSPGQFASTQLR